MEWGGTILSTSPNHFRYAHVNINHVLFAMCGGGKEGGGSASLPRPFSIHDEIKRKVNL